MKQHKHRFDNRRFYNIGEYDFYFKKCKVCKQIIKIKEKFFQPNKAIDAWVIKPNEY